jgi:glycosyltransferase involved in cell wall biosynthesis
MVLHPATYDSGGMAAAEAMAWGLPGISFDLESLKTYYPKGVIKITCFNNQEFADSIIQLLSNIILYNKLSIEARQLIQKHWSWPKRANYIYSQIIK